MKKTSSILARRLLALTLAFLLVAGLTGCWKKDKTDPAPSTEPSVETEPSTQAPTQAPTAAPTEEVTEPVTEDTTPVVSNPMGTVTATKLNIRSKPEAGDNVVGSYFKDDRLEFLELIEGWGRTAKGWVNLEYIKLDTTSDAPATTEPPTTTETKNDDVVTDGSTKALGHGVITNGSVNVRTGPSTDYEKVTTYSLGERYAYYQKSGNWIRTDKGWISLSYFYVEGETGEGATNGTISGENLNIRTGPGTGYASNGSYKKGESVRILAQVNGWGYTSKGWISMKYVETDATVSEGNKGTGTITADKLNIRKSGDNNAAVVGSYVKDDKVEILEVKDGWGRTDKGWISMAYVDLDSSTITSVYKTGKGTITATELYIRESGDKDAKAVGSYKKDEKVEILEVKGAWGRTDKGWVYLEYVKMDG